MTLESFEVLPRGNAGWTSGKLHFGANTTLLLGGNGSGKTPIVRALAFALGQPVQLPSLLQEKCSGVRLILKQGEHRVVLERVFDAIQSKVIDGDSPTVLRDDRQLAEFLLPYLGVLPRTLLGKNGQPVPPYLSVIGPMFIVNQDSGWLSGYVPYEAHQFIKDQREEVLRWALALPARNRPVEKAEYESARVRLESLQHQIKVKRDALASLELTLGEDRGPDALERLRARKESVDADFRVAFNVVGEQGRDSRELDVRSQHLNQARQAISFKLVSLRRRREQLAGVQAELGAEMDALEQNETAAEVFRVFCGSAACQLFRRPDASYGRRVLYIKDQLKDFESNAGEVEREIALIETQLAAAEDELGASLAERREKTASSGAAAALDALQRLSREVTGVQARIDAIGRVEAVRRELEKLLAEEQLAAETVSDLKPTRGPRRDVGRVLDARTRMAETFKEWMAVLRTPNVSQDVTVDDRFNVIIGEEPFRTGSSHSGSTRTRLVLAYHASVMETSFDVGGVHPPLLILDAPRQHELHPDDLRSFVERFCLKARDAWKESPQLVFSATDRNVVPSGCIDMLWEPTFKFGETLRFLGPAENPSGR